MVFHVLNTWRMYYEYKSTTKQVLTSVKTVLTSTSLYIIKSKHD